MTLSALFCLTQTSLNREVDFSATQALVDRGTSHFLEESARFSTFASIVVGGGVGRLGRTGVLALGANATGRTAQVVQGVASAVSIGAEAVAFETTNRLTIGLISPIRPINIWRWNGEGGLRQGFLSAGINFTAFRGAGSLSQGQNIVFRHAAQSTAMVGGHHVAGALHVIAAPEDPLALQFFHAEWMNLELGAGMGLFHSMAPGLHAMERGLDLSNRSRSEIRPRGIDRREDADPRVAAEAGAGSSRLSSRIFDFLRPRRNPNVFEMSIKPPGDGDEGNGGRGRRDTLPDVRRPSSAGRGSDPGVGTEPAKIYRIEGIPDGTRKIRVQASPNDPAPRLVDAIERYFNFLFSSKQELQSIIIQYEGESLDARVFGQMRVDMHRIFSDYPLPENVAVAVTVPKTNQATVYRMKMGVLRVERLPLTDISDPATRATQPNPPRIDAPDAADPARVVEILQTVLAQENPTLRYTGTIYKGEKDVAYLARMLAAAYPLPRDKTLTFILERQNKQVVFYWSGNEVLTREEEARPREASPPRRPSVTPPPIAAAAAPTAPRKSLSMTEIPSPDQRTDTVTCHRVEDVLEAFRRFVNPGKGEWVAAPAIRLNVGKIENSDLPAFVRILFENPPIPNGHRIIIAWNDRGGRRLTFERQSDRIVAEFKTAMTGEQRIFWILPEDPLLRNFRAYDSQLLRTYAYEGQVEYDRKSNEWIQSLEDRILPKDGPPLLPRQEEGPALRAYRLARLTEQILDGHPRGEMPFSPGELTQIGEIQRILERAYTLLDFETIQGFRERLGHEGLSLYHSAIARLNEGAEANAQAPWVPLDQIDLLLPGRHVIPVNDHLRHAFLSQVYGNIQGVRSPRETMILLRDPVRVGQIFRSMFCLYLGALFHNLDSLRSRTRGENMGDLLRTGPAHLSPDSQNLRAEVLSRLSDLQEYARILNEGRGDFHARFLRSAFGDPPDMQVLYGRLLEQLEDIPGPLYGNAELPPADFIRRAARSERPRSR